MDGESSGNFGSLYILLSIIFKLTSGNFLSFALSGHFSGVPCDKESVNGSLARQWDNFMSILLINDKFNPKIWTEALRALDPSLNIEIWPQVKDPAKVEFAIVWHYPQGELQRYPKLKAIQSMGAGVDHILSDPQRPSVPIARIVDPYLISEMSQYVIATTLYYARRLDFYIAAKAKKAWLPQVLKDKRIGIMGLGQLGSDAAAKLTGLGFQVSGWSRRPKSLEGAHCFSGEAQLPAFLRQSDILICLLPLTAETRGILNADLFAKLPQGAYLINAARGQHLVETDLLQALDKGQLAGASLDVFEVEPLPQDHLFWSHPKILVTPHIASVTRADSAAAQMLENYRRALSGRPLLHAVDVTVGY